MPSKPEDEVDAAGAAAGARAEAVGGRDAGRAAGGALSLSRLPPSICIWSTRISVL